MFGRATITLGIGPHSSSNSFLVNETVDLVTNYNATGESPPSTCKRRTVAKISVKTAADTHTTLSSIDV